MSPSKPAGVLKVQVPRHNAQRLGPAVTEQVRVIAREQGLVVQLAPPVQEQPGNASSSSAVSMLVMHLPGILKSDMRGLSIRPGERV